MVFPPEKVNVGRFGQGDPGVLLHLYSCLNYHVALDNNSIVSGTGVSKSYLLCI